MSIFVNNESMSLRMIGLLVVVGILGGCFNKPVFPLEPSIAFQSIERNAAAAGDSITITISFQDGDGDLGLAPNERENEINYFIITKRRRGEAYAEVPFPDGQTFNGRFPVLRDTPFPRPLEGDIIYSFAILLSLTDAVLKGDTLAFDVRITDRAGNSSNTITTSDVILGGGQ
jgi:hypothetical protein